MRSGYPRVLLLTATALLAVSCGPASTIKSKATWLCVHGMAEGPALELFPAGISPEDYLTEEDTAFLRDQGDGNAMSNALNAATAPIAVSLAEAMAPHTTCVAGTVAIEGDQATVEVKRTRPYLGAIAGVALLAELALEPSHEARVKNVQAKIAASNKQETTDHTLSFYKGEDGWRADFGLMERLVE